VSITFPGTPPIISAVRKVVAYLMVGFPRAEDAVLIACEFATNAIRHSPSGQPGGHFTLRIWIKPGWVKLEVADLGTGNWVVRPEGPADFAHETGRGLVVVAALADIWGHSGGRAWAEISWPPSRSARPRLG
jgi:anti-sigma regulatory factor (Ser/Thr protein kinase)